MHRRTLKRRLNHLETARVKKWKKDIMDKRTVIVIAVVAVCVIGAIVGFVCLSNQGNPGTVTSTNPSGQGLTFETNEDADTITIRSIVMPGWSQLAIPANTKDVTVDFYNPEENAGYFHMTFELILNETGETLYKSGLIRAGDHVRHISLSRGLPAGTYDATLHIQPYTADEAMTATNNANVSLKLIVS